MALSFLGKDEQVILLLMFHGKFICIKTIKKEKYSSNEAFDS